MMAAAHRLLIGVLLLLPFAACVSVGSQPRRPFPVATELDFLSVCCFKQETIDDCATKKDKACRDKIVFGQLHAYDLVLSEFEDRLTRLSQGIDLTGDLVSGLASAAGTVVKGTQTKSIVSALSTFATGAKSSAEADLFFQKSITTIVARIEALRKEALVPILAGLLKEPTEYPLYLALEDVEGYFKAVNLMQALASIDENSTQKAKVADEQKNTLLNLTFGDDENSALIRNFWLPNGTENATNVKALQDWIDTNVKKGLHVPDFIHGKAYADARKKAVADLVNK